MTLTLNPVLLICNDDICVIVVVVVVFIISSSNSNSINITIIIIRYSGTGYRELSASKSASTVRKAQRAVPLRMRFTTLMSSDCDKNTCAHWRLQAAAYL